MSKLSDAVLKALRVKYKVHTEVTLRKIARAVGSETNWPLLRIDFFIPEYGIAIEVQGKQHFVKGFGITNDNFEKLQFYDEIKGRELERLGVDLLYINYNEQVSELIKNVQLSIEKGDNKWLAAVVDIRKTHSVLFSAQRKWKPRKIPQNKKKMEWKCSGKSSAWEKKVKKFPSDKKRRSDWNKKK